MRKEKKPPGTNLSLGSTAKVTKNMLPARATAKSWLKKSQIAHEFCLVQRPYILDVVERAYENKKRGGFVHLKRRGMGVFFSRFALILAYCARSRALSNCQKKKKKKKRNANNKQPTTKTKKKKNVCGQATWIIAILAIFSSFFYLTVKARFSASDHIERVRKAIYKTERRLTPQILCKARGKEHISWIQQF